jgi:hypothetical protein
MKHNGLLLGFASIAFLSFGCGSPHSSPSFASVDCATLSTASLTHYDQISQKFLDQITLQPPDNNEGDVVWNTRYYLESLLIGYNATGNSKYIQAFLDTGTWVMNLTQTLTYVDTYDPSAPGNTVFGPLGSVTGWPTYIATFGVSTAVPTATGKVALYAQSLNASGAAGAGQLNVSENGDGSLQLNWSRGSNTLQSFTVRTVEDLNAIGSQPLIYQQTPGRLKATGIGLPAPGSYALGNPLLTIWHGEQTGGVLLPFVEFLLIAREHPGLVDEQIATAWESKILSIAAEYENQFVPDGDGGLLIVNPEWMPSSEAGLVAAADYVYVEATMRLLLYELTQDPKHLSIAEGLALHQVRANWQLNPRGWVLLKLWPDIRPWQSHSQAPPGSIWDQLNYDPSNPEISGVGDFVTDLMHFAKVYNVAADFGFSDDVFAAQSTTFQKYLRIPSGVPSLVRNGYPTFDSRPSHPTAASDDPFAGAGFLQPEVADPSFVVDNWDWMNANAPDPSDEPVGYFLRAWAHTEAAALQSCQSEQSKKSR